MTSIIIALIALVAGLAAAGAVLFTLDRRRSGFARRQEGASRFAIPAAVFVIAVAVVGGALYLFTGAGGGAPANRVLDAIQRHHPEAGAEIEAIKRETNPVAAQQRSADLAQRYMPRHIPTTSDVAVLRFTNELTKVFESLAQKDPETCKALTTSGKASASFDPQNMRAALDAMADVIDDSVNAPQPPPQQQRAQQLLSGVTERVYAKPNANLVAPQMLAQAATLPAAQLCNTMIAYYREILRLPPQDASTVLRMLMRGPSATR